MNFSWVAKIEHKQDKLGGISLLEARRWTKFNKTIKEFIRTIKYWRKVKRRWAWKRFCHFTIYFGDKLKRKLLSISWKMLSYQRVQTETNFIRVGVRTISHCMVVALAMRDVTENILLVFDHLKIFKLTNLISSFKLI